MRWSNQIHQRCYIVSRLSVELDKGLGKTLPQNYNVIGHNGLFNLREVRKKYKKNMAQWTRENVLKCAANRSGVRGQLSLGQLADTGSGKVW